MHPISCFSWELPPVLVDGYQRNVTLAMFTPHDGRAQPEEGH